MYQRLADLAEVRGGAGAVRMRKGELGGQEVHSESAVWGFKVLPVERGYGGVMGSSGVRCGNEWLKEKMGRSWEIWPSRAQQTRALDGSAL